MQHSHSSTVKTGERAKHQRRRRSGVTNAFRQQKLRAWQPILSATCVLPIFFVLGLAFVPLGIGLFNFSDDAKEFSIDYTNCVNEDSVSCAEVITSSAGPSECNCALNFTLDHDFDGKVFVYYGLSNFYQNHRRYVTSRDDKQLLGDLESPPSTNCLPFVASDDSGVLKPIVPCGAIANSMYNDVLHIYSQTHRETVPMLRTGIAWPSDKQIKFKNPPGDLRAAFGAFAKPVNWRRHVYELDPQDPSNNGLQNEDLMVWMRTAASSTFRKLYRRVDHSVTGFGAGLLRGNYTLHVQYNYPVRAFRGTKRMILATTSLIGAKNTFLGVAYIVVGLICLLLGVLLFSTHLKYGKSTAQKIVIDAKTPYLLQTTAASRAPNKTGKQQLA